jgi:hypothetical protein
MAYSKAKLKNSGDNTSRCFKPFWLGKLPDKVYLYGLYCFLFVEIRTMDKFQKLNSNEDFTMFHLNTF